MTTGLKNMSSAIDSFQPRKMSLLLDLDATCINSLDKYELKLASKQFQNKFKFYDMKGYYRIFERPHLQNFLDYAFTNFDVSIFTAADKDYALFIAENIILSKPGRQLRYLFYGYASGLSESYYDSPKDLRLLWDVLKVDGFTPCNTLLIDDLSDVAEANPNNVIRAPKFELLKNGKADTNQIYDTFFLTLIPQLETYLANFRKSSCSCIHSTINCNQKIINKLTF